MFPPPTIEERIANVPEHQKILAAAIERERGNIRFALHYVLAHDTPTIQKEADYLLQHLDDISPVELAYSVRNMHYPKTLHGRKTAGFIALGTMHRALAKYWQTEPTHIHHALRKVLEYAKPLGSKNPSKRTQVQNTWKQEHAGMRPLMD